jgi:glycine/D-amino acid oxidase-like deaminating enzyme
MATQSNLWRKSAKEEFIAAALTDTVTADLVIVGGGFTGCSAALHAAEAGASVVLLEAETVGHGGSGRNAGLVNAGLWLPPDDVEKVLGPEQGNRLNKRLAEGPDLVFSLIEKHEIACDAVRNGTLHCAHAPAGMRDLERRYAQQMAREAPVKLLGRNEAVERTSIETIHGALFDARAGTIQPLSYCRGLARAARQAGARIFERSPAIAIAHDPTGWRIMTPTGEVHAPRLLMATNAYHQPADGVSSPEYIPVHYFQLATKPLSDNLVRAVLPGGEGCWDTAPVMSSFRMDAAGRFIVGGIGALDHPGQGIHCAWAERKLAALAPKLAGQPIEHAWFGRIAMTSDHVPKIKDLGGAGFQVFGYSGRGISPGTTFGRALAEALLASDKSLLPIDPIDDYAEPFHRVRQGYYELGAALTHLVSR